MAKVQTRLMVVLLAGVLLACCQGQDFGFDESKGFEAELPVDPSTNWAVDKPRQPPSRFGLKHRSRTDPSPKPVPNIVQADVPSQYQAILQLHNKFRATHQAPALVWDPTLAEQTAAYAANCTWAHGSFGENMYLTSKTNDVAAALTDAVTQWYSEVVQYNFTRPGFNTTTGHFTQVVWRSSKQLGCAAQICANGVKGSGFAQGTLVICRYLPVGNIAGQFARNVFPPVSPPNATNIEPGTVLRSPDCRPSLSRRYMLCMRRDGKLLWLSHTRNGDVTLWSSNSRVLPAARSSFMQAVLGDDGNFKVLDSQGAAIWSSNTGGGAEPRRLALQDDGDMVLYDANNVTLWQTKQQRQMQSLRP